MNNEGGSAVVDFAAVTTRQQAMWATGDFHRIGVSQIGVGERLVRSARVRAGERVLDVAAGAGNTSLAAARRFAEVLATDYVPDLLGHAQTRAAAEGLPLKTEVADAQALPYDDHAFDVVVSTFGAMFAPDQQRTADELLRVTRPGGRIAMANWTPSGMVGEMFALGARYLPPPEGVRPPSRWGTEDGLRELFGDAIGELTLRERTADFVYPSLDFMLEYFRTWFGPTAMTFAALDAERQASFAAELVEVWGRHNTVDDGSVLSPGRYLEVVATKR
jgi:SAM-dependent methyltransferase